MGSRHIDSIDKMKNETVTMTVYDHTKEIVRTRNESYREGMTDIVAHGLNKIGLICSRCDHFKIDREHRTEGLCFKHNITRNDRDFCSDHSEVAPNLAQLDWWDWER